MATTKELRSKLYDNGEFDDCLSAVESERRARAQDDPEQVELLALAGWCRYRKGEYEVAQQLFEEAGQVSFAREGLLYIAVYRTKDDAKAREIARELGDRVNVQNALVIRARDADSTFSHDEIILAISRFQGPEVEVANLYHNGGRFFLAKARGREDLVFALGFLEMAAVRYGIDRNWHHRGALNFWRSKVLEQLLDKRGALEAARGSYYCWVQQCILDPGTERHRQQLENAHKRILELLI